MKCIPVVKKLVNRLILVSALVGCLSFSYLAAQAYDPISGKSMADLQRPVESYQSIHLQHSALLVPLLPKNKMTPKLPQVYDYKELGIFCKLDVQLEKHLKFPVRFRLGEAQQVARKEGKY